MPPVNMRQHEERLHWQAELSLKAIASEGMCLHELQVKLSPEDLANCNHACAKVSQPDIRSGWPGFHGLMNAKSRCIHTGLSL